MLRGGGAIAAVLACAVTACVGAVAPPALAADSVTFQADAAHDGFVDESIAPPLAVSWSRDLGGSAASYPIIADGRVFITTAVPDGPYGTTLHALDAATGADLWSAPIAGTYYWSALAYDGGKLFVLNFDGRVAARDPATGAELWSTKLSQYSFSAPPMAVNGTLYVSGAGSGGTLYAIDEANGSVKWSEPVENGDDSSPAYDGSRVYVAYSGPQAYGFNAATGAQVWHYSGASEGGGGETATVHDGRVFFNDGVGGGGFVLDASNGSGLTSFPAGTIPAFAGNLGVFNENGTLRGRDATSLAVRWSAAPPSGTFDSPPLIVGSSVYDVGGGQVYGLDSGTGAITWSCSVDGLGSPETGTFGSLAAGEGLLLVPTQQGLVAFAHAPASVCPSAPAATPVSSAAPSTAAPTATAYGGNTLIRGVPVGTSIGLERLADGQVEGRLGYALRCRGHRFPNVATYVHGLAQGAAFTATGTSRLTRRGRIRFTLSGTFTATGATGTLRERTTHIRCEHVRAPFRLRAASQPTGLAARPTHRVMLAGLSTQHAGGVALPVTLWVGRYRKRLQVGGIWQATMRCGPRAVFSLVNLSPFTRIRGDASFVRRERFTIRFTDGSREVFRVVLRGHFLTDGAVGTLRAHMQIHQRGHKFFPCDSGTQSWSAAP